MSEAKENEAINKIKQDVNDYLERMSHEEEEDVGFGGKLPYYIQMGVFVVFQFIPLVLIVYCVIIDIINQLASFIVITFNFLYVIFSNEDAFTNNRTLRIVIQWVEKLCWLFYGYPVVCVLFSIVLKLTGGFFDALTDFFSIESILNLRRDVKEYFLIQKLIEKETSDLKYSQSTYQSMLMNHKIQYLKSRKKNALINFIISLVIILVVVAYVAVFLLSLFLDFNTNQFHAFYAGVYLLIPLIGLTDVMLRSFDIYRICHKFLKNNKFTSITDVVKFTKGEPIPSKEKFEISYVRCTSSLTTSILRTLLASRVIPYLYPSDLSSMSELSEIVHNNIIAVFNTPFLYNISFVVGMIAKAFLIVYDGVTHAKVNSYFPTAIASYAIYIYFCFFARIVSSYCFSWSLMVGKLERITQKAKIVHITRKIIKENTCTLVNGRKDYDHSNKELRLFWYYSPRQLHDKFDEVNIKNNGETNIWSTYRSVRLTIRSCCCATKCCDCCSNGCCACGCVCKKYSKDPNSAGNIFLRICSMICGFNKQIPEECTDEINQREIVELQKISKTRQMENKTQKFNHRISTVSDKEDNQEEEEEEEEKKEEENKKDEEDEKSAIQQFLGSDSNLRYAGAFVEFLYVIIMIFIGAISIAIAVWRDPTTRTGGRKYYVALEMSQGYYTEPTRYPAHCTSSVSGMLPVELSALPQLAYFSSPIIPDSTRDFNTRVLIDMAFRSQLEQGRTVECEHRVDDRLVDCVVSKDGQTVFHVVVPHGMTDRRDWLYMLEMLIMQYTSSIIEQVIPLFEFIIDLFGQLIYFVQDGIQQLTSVYLITIHRARTLREWAANLDGNANIAVGQNIGGYFAKYLGYSLPDKFSAYSWDSLSFMSGALKLDESEDGPPPNIFNVFSESSIFGVDEEGTVNIERSKYDFGMIKSFTRPPNATDAFCKTVAECSNEQRYIDFCESILGHEAFLYEMELNGRMYVIEDEKE